MIGPLLFLCLLSGLILLALGLGGKQADVGKGFRRIHRSAAAAGLLSPIVILAAGMAGLVVGGVAWASTGLPILALAGALAGVYAPFVLVRRRRERAARDRERAWPAVLTQLADALETGIAFPAAVGLLASSGPAALRLEFGRFQARLRTEGLDDALDRLPGADDNTARTVVLLMRAGLVDLPSGGLAPLLRELAAVLRERFEVREKVRTKASSLQVEAAILALSPIVLLLLVGSASPAYMAAYRTGVGTAVAAAGGVAIFACYLAMRRLGRIPEPGRKRAGR